MNLNNIIHELEIWENWSENYQKFVPLFIKEAQTKDNWTDWDPAIWTEFFEKNRDQCVSSLQQGYFTNTEKAEIKSRWTEVSPLLKKIADNQDFLDIVTYEKISEWFRQLTSQNRKTSFNRIIASLQPRLLTTVVNENRLDRLIWEMNNMDSVEVINNSGNWYEKSNRMLEYFKDQFPAKDYPEIATLPWQLYDYFIDDDTHTNEMSEISSTSAKNIEILQYKKQIILQGPPGTGKTREAKLIAKEILGLSDINELQNNPQFEIVQFHPSYSYEDFIEGLKPVQTEDKQITYETVNGSFKRFCERALLSCIDIQTEEMHDVDFNSLFNEYLKDLANRPEPVIFKTKNNVELVLDSSTETSITAKYRYSNREKTSPGTNPFVVSKNKLQRVLQAEINPDNVKNIKADLFPITGHISGELFAVYRDLYAFIQSKKINISDVEVATYDYEQIVNLYRGARDNGTLKIDKKFIFVIDEMNRANLPAVLGELIYALEYRGYEIMSVYSPEEGNQLIIPPNLYIIGTMNTADRSVGHIDYAVRRRFAFVDVPPETLNDDEDIYFNAEKFAAVARMFTKDFVSSDFDAKDVQIGHSYFIAEKKDATTEAIRDTMFQMKMDYEVKPILREYLKDGILLQDKKVGEQNQSIAEYIESL